MNQQHARWLGLSALIGDAVENGSKAIESIHMATARRPFKIIESIPPLAAPTHVVHVVHDVIVTNTYKQIRFWNAAVQKVVRVALAYGTTAPDTTESTPAPAPAKLSDDSDA